MSPSLLLSLVFLSITWRLLLSWLLNCPHNVLFQSLLLQNQTVLVPNEVWRLGVEVVALHAAIKQVQDVSVVWVVREFKTSAVLHELFELNWLVQAQLVDGHLLLFSLDVVVFLVLAAAWKSLPWQGASQEVQQDVTNGLQVVTAGLLITQVGV